MTESYAETIGKKIRTSGAIVPIGTTVLVMILVSGILWMMDNYSSYVAVLDMSVNAVRPDANWFGRVLVWSSYVAKAFVPQGLATIMFAVFLMMEAETNTELVYKWGSLFIGIISWTYDGWTGYVFYLEPQAVGISIWRYYNDPVLHPFFRDALINAIVYDALGSEFLLSITVGIFSVIAEDYMRQVRGLRRTFAGMAPRIPIMRPAPDPIPPRDNGNDVPVRGPVTPIDRRPRPARPNGMRRSPLNGIGRVRQSPPDVGRPQR